MRHLRQVLFLIFCLTLIFTLTGQTTFPQTYYITVASANARSCPETSCDRVASLRRGTSITVRGTETGTTVSGSDVWLRFTYNGDTAYVHSSLASTRNPNTGNGITTGGGASNNGGIITGGNNSTNNTTTGGTTGGNISTPVPSTSGGGSSTGGGGSVSCNGATTCGQMNSCEQARACLAGGRDSLDRDNDGIPCESLCGG